MDAGDAVILCTDTVRLKGLYLTESAMASVLEELSSALTELEVFSALEEPSTGTVLEELSSALTELEVVSALEEPRTGTAHRVLPLSPRTDATANMWTS